MILYDLLTHNQSCHHNGHGTGSWDKVTRPKLRKVSPNQVTSYQENTEFLTPPHFSLKSTVRKWIPILGTCNLWIKPPHLLWALCWSQLPIGLGPHWLSGVVGRCWEGTLGHLMILVPVVMAQMRHSMMCTKHRLQGWLKIIWEEWQLRRGGLPGCLILWQRGWDCPRGGQNNPQWVNYFGGVCHDCLDVGILCPISATVDWGYHMGLGELGGVDGRGKEGVQFISQPSSHDEVHSMEIRSGGTSLPRRWWEGEMVVRMAHKLISAGVNRNKVSKHMRGGTEQKLVE